MRKAATVVTRYELLLLGLATPLLLFPGAWSPIGLAVIGITWVIRLLARGRFSARTAMDVPIVFLLVMVGVSLIPSVDLDLSLNRAWIYVLGVALFYGMANGLHSERHIHLAGLGLVLLGLLVALVSFLGTDWEIGKLVEMPAIYGRLPGPIIRGLPGSGVIEEYDLFNPRVVAGALAILVPIPLAYLILGEGRNLRLLSGLTALVMTGVLALTQAPQGFLGLAAALLLILLWWNRWIVLGLPLGLGGLLMAWRLLGIQQMVGKWLTADNLTALNFGIYSRAVNGAWAIATVRDMPYTGIGLNTFPVVNELYSSGRDHVPHAHNTLIQTAVDLGIPGLIVLIALLAAFGFTVAHAYRASLDRNQRALLIGICAAVAAWLAYGMLDSITLGHKPAAALWVMLGLAASIRLGAETCATEAVEPRSGLTRRRAVAVALPLLLLLAVVGLTRSKIVSTLNLNLGVMEAHRALDNAALPGAAARHLDAAEVHLRAATRWDPGGTRAYRLLEWIDELDGQVLSKPWPRDSANVERWRNVF